VKFGYVQVTCIHAQANNETTWSYLLVAHSVTSSVVSEILELSDFQFTVVVVSTFAFNALVAAVDKGRSESAAFLVTVGSDKSTTGIISSVVGVTLVNCVILLLVGILTWDYS